MSIQNRMRWALLPLIAAGCAPADPAGPADTNGPAKAKTATWVVYTIPG